MAYNFKQIEKKWQKKWEEAKAFEAKDNSKKPKYYVLEMFPYPSGSGLHMGHAWNYTIGDILARFKLMQGFSVLHPMGFDALGLPAENAAIQAGEHPENYTNKSIKNYVRQQKNLGLTYDWSRIVNTADPDYYKWDQWIFLKMFEKGLVYQKEAAVNWCPKCNTILANEQVVDGKCWRHDDTEVEIKSMKQWFLKITDYADRLLIGHEKLDWPSRTIAMQKNWIGKSYGVNVSWKIKENENILKTFTTTVDTLYGVTFMVISPEHPLLNELVTNNQRKDVESYLKEVRKKSDLERTDLNKNKTGVFTGSYVINPLNESEVPLYVADYVLMSYGTGVVMGVPAHDQRDMDFAKKYKILSKQVLELDGKSFVYDDVDKYNVNGVLTNSGKFSGLSVKEGREAITKELETLGMVERTVQYKLKDWSVARQRYWGTPIPLIHCEKCGIVPVPESDLPVKLPKKVKFGDGNPLETNEDWLNVRCPECGGKAKREANTLDTFVNSSWYFLRYCDPHNDKKIFDVKKVKYWMPVDCYIGGAEHACMHLIYARFYTMFLHDLGLVDFEEFAPRLFHQGMLHAEGGVKMSKSKGNVVAPEVVSDRYGIDTARFFLSGLASPDKDIDWEEKGIQGSLRFMNRVIDYFEDVEFGKASEKVEFLLNKTLKNIGVYFDTFEYRKATIELRALFDLIEKEKVGKDVLEKFLQMFSPFCPHITEELWSKLDHKDFLSLSEWPKVDESKLKAKKKEVDLNAKIVENVNGILEKVKDVKKVYVYVMPFEIAKIDQKKIAKEVGKDVEVFSTADKKKYDPQNKSKKARPGLASVYVE